jgi:hypothetical protein
MDGKITPQEYAKIAQEEPMTFEKVEEDREFTVRIPTE